MQLPIDKFIEKFPRISAFIWGPICQKCKDKNLMSISTIDYYKCPICGYKKAKGGKKMGILNKEEEQKVPKWKSTVNTKAKEIREKTEEYIESNPKKSAVIGVVAGLLAGLGLGKLFRRRK